MVSMNFDAEAEIGKAMLQLARSEGHLPGLPISSQSSREGAAAGGRNTAKRRKRTEGYTRPQKAETRAAVLESILKGKDWERAEDVARRAGLAVHTARRHLYDLEDMGKVKSKPKGTGNAIVWRAL